MISTDYIVQNLRGVWRMAFGGGDWRADLDRTTDGVFKSFWAVALSAPFAALAFTATHRALIDTPQFDDSILATAPFSVLLLAEMVSLALHWAASVAALVFTAQSINATRRAADVIVAFNWSRFIAIIAVAAPAVFLGLTGNAGLFALFYLPALFFSLILVWRILRACLPLSGVMTISLIVMLILIEVIVDALVTYGAVGLYGLLS